jgi:dihydroxyacetone kinase DhaKLM complex PTS-EIIA-like component DhaM
MCWCAILGGKLRKIEQLLQLGQIAQEVVVPTDVGSSILNQQLDKVATR